MIIDKRFLLACLAIAALCGKPALAQIGLTVDSLADLRSRGLTVNNTKVTLSATGGDPHPVTGIVTPGHYWINGDHIADPTNSMPIFMELSGTDNIYDLSGATINLDTRKLDGFGRNLGHESGVDVIQITGSGNTVQGITLIGQDIALNTDPNAQRYADWATQYVELSGVNNTVDGAHVVTRGSRTDTYGLSDAFGKGSSQGNSPFIGHRKASAFRVGEATNAVVNDMHLEVNTFGHGFFVQESNNTTLTNSTVTGEMFSSSLVVNRPEYQLEGHTWWGEPIPDDILLAGAEGGVRVYNGASGLTVDNVVVTNMRTGFATVGDGGDVNINNSFAYGTTSGFDVGDNTTITNSGGSIVNGPLLVFYGNGSNTSIDLELTSGAPVGTNWSAAYFNGDADITISSDPSVILPQESVVRLGQNYFENWREHDYNTADAESDSRTRGAPTPYTNATFHNNTNQMLILGENAFGNTGSSQGFVVTNGKDNAYDGVSIVLSGSRVVLTHVNGLGNNGTAADGSLESNASIVLSGATLEVSPGLRIQNEKLTISGVGLDGRGALYSDGSVDGGTRFGSSNGSDESTIFLNGDSAIGVGVAGNQMLVGRIQGAGQLTKLGLGSLSIEKSATYTGDFVVQEGHVSIRSGVVNHGLTVASGASIGGISNNAYNTSDTAIIDGELDVNARSDTGSLVGKVGSLYGSGNITASNVTGINPSELAIGGASTGGIFTGQIQGNLSIVKTGGSLQLLNGASNYTGTTTVEDGLLIVNGTHTGGDVYTVENGATLAGDGSINTTVVVEAGGELNPGSLSREFTIQDVQLQANSSLNIELAGTVGGVNHDLLSVDSIALGGDLSVSLGGTSTGAFAPGANDIFTIVDADVSLTGAFANVASGSRIDTAGGEGSFQVVYSSAVDRVILANFEPSGLLGDFSGNGIVDAADFTIWRDTLGLTGIAPFSGADATGDGNIDAADYIVWQNNFGNSLPSSVVSVPEPSGWILVLFSAVFFALANRRDSTRRQG